jgi:hypothetical protein
MFEIGTVQLIMNSVVHQIFLTDGLFLGKNSVGFLGVVFNRVMKLRLLPRSGDIDGRDGWTCGHSGG